jgi:hypothetical protein
VHLVAQPVGKWKPLGKSYASERREHRLVLKKIAEQIIKADGYPISVQYLDNLEKDLRTPSPALIPQFAEVLQLPADLLYCALGLFPPDILKSVETRDQLLSALQTFRKTILAHVGKKWNDRKLVRYHYASPPPHFLESNTPLRNPRVRSPEEWRKSKKTVYYPIGLPNILLHIGQIKAFIDLQRDE